MIDLLYIKGSKSINNDDELRYSLRSLRFVKDKGRVFITGECPSFVQNIIHTPAKDIGCRTINHWWKVKQTILSTDIGENFVLMYDDIFFIKEVELSNYPYYNRGLIKDHKTGTSSYIENLKEAQRVLMKMNKPTVDYTLHIPCIYNREKFLQMDFYEEYLNKPIAPSVRCMYGNLNFENTPYREDLKIRSKSDKIGDVDCFSTADDTFNNVLPMLKGLFPRECEYENSILHR